MLPFAILRALFPEGRRRANNPPRYRGAHAGRDARSRAAGCLGAFLLPVILVGALTVRGCDRHPCTGKACHPRPASVVSTR